MSQTFFFPSLHDEVEQLPSRIMGMSNEKNKKKTHLNHNTIAAAIFSNLVLNENRVVLVPTYSLKATSHETER